MPLMLLKPNALLKHVDEFIAQRLEAGTLPWLLAQLTLWFPAWLVGSWRGQSHRGRPAWPAAPLLVLVLLRWAEEGQSRRSACERRVVNDMSWRAAMGLPSHLLGPSEKTVREFEGYLRGRDEKAGLPRYLLVMEHIVRACLQAGMLGPSPQIAMDSTPMWCYGAVQDTLRLLGQGLRHLGARWAMAHRTTLEQVAMEWEMPLLVAKSIKGHFEVNWNDPTATATLVNQIAEQVVRAIEEVRSGIQSLPRAADRKKLLRICRHLTRVMHNDLETDPKGRLVVAERVAKDRLLSLTDPQARHGHKSRRRTFDGFKIHLLGDLVSGLLLSLCVTPGNEHDGKPAHRLIRRAKELYEELEQVLGDTAYGAARLRYLVRGTTGVAILAPPPPDTHPAGRLGKKHIKLNLLQGMATCAAGVPTDDMRWVWSEEIGVKVRKFKWQKADCDACPLSAPCRGKQTGGHTVLLHPYEEELRRAREQFSQKEVRQGYRLRTQGERLVNQVTRHGGRTARGFGLGSANLQAHLIAMADNLRLLARQLAPFTP